MRIHHLNCGSLCPRGGKIVRRLRRPAVARAHVLPLPPDRGRRRTDPGRFRARGRGCQRAAAARISCSTRWCGHGSTSPRRRSGKSRIWASAQAMFATSCRPISTSTTPEGSAISPTLRSMFSPPSFARPRIGRRLASETAIAPRRSLRSRNGRQSRKRANPGLAFRPCARFPERATRCCWCRFPAIRAGIAASRSGERTIGCSIAATPISITPKSSRTAAPRRRACAFRVAGAVRRRAATRQPGALARTRAPRARRSQAHLLARPCRLSPR